MIKNFESEFLAFCKAKPADEKYHACSCTECALGQFAVKHGYSGGNRSYATRDPATGARDIIDLYPHSCYVAAVEEPEGLDQKGYDKWRTFGALVQRLEAAGVK